MEESATSQARRGAGSVKPGEPAGDCEGVAGRLIVPQEHVAAETQGSVSRGLCCCTTLRLRGALHWTGRADRLPKGCLDGTETLLGSAMLDAHARRLPCREPVAKAAEASAEGLAHGPLRRASCLVTASAPPERTHLPSGCLALNAEAAPGDQHLPAPG